MSDNTENNGKNSGNPFPENGNGTHNPMQKRLEINFLGCNPAQINSEDYLDKTMNEAIKRSKATLRKSLIDIFEPQGITGLYTLSESHSLYHTYPELNFISFAISTCGDGTHPFWSVSYLIERFNPAGGEINYSKVGMDNVNKSEIFPKKIETMIKKYSEQFVEKYKFLGRELKSCNYDFVFWDPDRKNKDDLRRNLGDSMEDFEKYATLATLLESKEVKPEAKESK